MVTVRLGYGLALFLALVGCGELTAPDAKQLAEAPKRPGEGESGVAWILGPNGEPGEARFVVRSGRAVHQGDIDLGAIEGVALTREEALRKRRANLAVVEPNYYWCTVPNLCLYSTRWPGGVVPYVFASGMTQAHRDSVLASLAFIHQGAPGVRFRPKGYNDVNWVRFTYDNDPTFCGLSALGRKGDGTTFNPVAGVQNLKLNPSNPFCVIGRELIVHEVFHALGSFHEQARCDRDDYIAIQWDNIPNDDDTEYQFAKQCAWAIDVGDYSESSIMHYDPYAFAQNPSLPTIVSLRGRPFGVQGDTLATSDWAGINYMYPAPVPPFGYFQVTHNEEADGHPWLAWTSSAGAEYYEIDIVSIYNEYNDVTGEHSSWEQSRYGAGNSTLTQFTDTARAYTGISNCLISGGWQWSIQEQLYYDITPVFWGGYRGPTVRTEAQVGC